MKIRVTENSYVQTELETRETTTTAHFSSNHIGHILVVKLCDHYQGCQLYVD